MLDAFTQLTELMGDFFSRFTPDPDPDMASVRRMMVADKPVLRNAVVAFAPPYPQYPKLKRGASRPASGDPSCPSARDVSDEILIRLCSNKANSSSDCQEIAWRFITGNASRIESMLRRKLFAQHQKSLGEFLEGMIPDDRETQSYWKKIESKIDWHDSSAVDHLYKLVGIELLDHGLDECGFSSFEFQSGWDRDHGVSILTHRNNTLAAAGMGEFTVGRDLATSAGLIQTYDFDKGDLPLK
ncbi:MAG: hypothetical protein AAFX06_29305 [Planctomycetota bacterium]